MLKYYFLTFFSALILGYLLTPLARKIALRFNLMDRPRVPVKVHREPTPYLGGAAVYLAFLIPVVIIGFFTSNLSQRMVGILFGGTIIMALGLADDLKGLPVSTRFLVQILAASVLILFGIRLEFIGNPYVALALTIIWVVGITNAFNLIDIMDGLSAGIAFIAASAFLFISLPTQQTFVILASAALAGSALGFLRYNFAPARIFMGDTGSLFLGFTLGALSIGTSYTAQNPIALLSPILILGIPIYDTLLVMALRTKRKRSIFRGSPDHLALRLEALGIDRKYVVLILYLMSIVLAQAAFISTIINLYGAIFTYVLVGIISFVGGRYLGRIDMEQRSK